MRSPTFVCHDLGLPAGSRQYRDDGYLVSMLRYGASRAERHHRERRGGKKRPPGSIGLGVRPSNAAIRSAGRADRSACRPGRAVHLLSPDGVAPAPGQCLVSSRGSRVTPTPVPVWDTGGARPRRCLRGRPRRWCRAWTSSASAGSDCSIGIPGFGRPLQASPAMIAQSDHLPTHGGDPCSASSGEIGSARW